MNTSENTGTPSFASAGDAARSFLSGNVATGTGAAADTRRIGFGPRLGAYLIDAVALSAVAVVLNIVHLGAIGSIVGLAYFLYFWSTSGQTLGMRLLKMKVVRTDGQALSWGTGAVRLGGYIVSAIPLCLGLLWVIWDPGKQGWHDKWAGTAVVRA